MENRPSWQRILIEFVVIVVSILVAFGIDASWEARQEAMRRAEIIESMTTDLETTRNRLAEIRARGDSLRTRAAEFLSAVSTKARLRPDSLGYLLAGAFRGIHFEPVLSSYTGAVATGDLGLVETPELLSALADFHQALGVYRQHEAVYDEFIFLGPAVDLRRRVGGWLTLEANANAPDMFRMTEGEYLEFVQDPAVYASVETGTLIHRQMINRLQDMDDAATRVLEELERVR